MAQNSLALAPRARRNASGMLAMLQRGGPPDSGRRMSDNGADCPPGFEPMPPAADHDLRVLLEVHVCLKEASTVPIKDVRGHVEDYLSTQYLTYKSGPVPLAKCNIAAIRENVESITLVCKGDSRVQEGSQLVFWQVHFSTFVFQLSEEGPAEEEGYDGEDGSAYREYELPAREFHGLWDTLLYDRDIKQRLLTYAATALFFSDCCVDSQLVSFNRTVLLHGEPGTGKTSLCKALAQLLSIRLSGRYKHSQLIEVHAHSIFSKYFSESGKLVSRLFGKIQELAEDKDSLIFVLIDEVESLTAARQAAFSGNEPADAIRAVNALLTQLDALKVHTNVLVLTTSNITEAIDLAFVDRADIKAYIGPPGWQARYEILLSCMTELKRAEIVDPSQILPPPFSIAIKCGIVKDPRAGSHVYPVAAANAAGGSNAISELMNAAFESEGFSGRTLRKLPFLAYASSLMPHSQQCSAFHLTAALRHAIQREKNERSRLDKRETSPQKAGPPDMRA